MVRALARHLRPLLAGAGSVFERGQSIAAYAVPAIAVPKVGGLFGGGKRVTTPLSEPLPNVSLPNRTTPKAPELQAATLNGGVKAACLDVAGPVSCVSVVVGGGSAAETADTAGASKVLEYLAFSATANRTSFRLTRELEKYGAAARCVAGRESISYCVEGPSLQAAEVTEMLLDAVLNQKLADWEVRDMLERVQDDLDDAYGDAALLAHELLHKAAFSGGLANSLLPDPAALGSLSADALRAYVAQQFVGSNMAVAGAGISLAALQQVAEPLLAAAGSGAAPAAPASSYTGGVLVALSPGAEPTVGVAFQAKGGLGDLKATATATVAKALLAAPVREVLPWQGKALEGPLTSVTPVVQLYKSTGLIGLLGSTTPGYAAAAADALAGRLRELGASPPQEAALAAAKALSLRGYQASIAGRAGVAADIGLQLMARGKFSAADFAAAVSGVSGADVAKYIGEAAKGPATLVAVGSMADLPKFNAAAGKLA